MQAHPYQLVYDPSAYQQIIEALNG